LLVVEVAPVLGAGAALVAPVLGAGVGLVAPLLGAVAPGLGVAVLVLGAL
jgi:hypothetical protein